MLHFACDKALCFISRPNLIKNRPTAAPTEPDAICFGGGVFKAFCACVLPHAKFRESKSDITDPARVRGRTKSGITIPCIIPSIPTASLCAMPPFLNAEIKSISSCILKRLPQSDVIIHGAETHKSFVRISLLGGAVQAAQSRPKPSVLLFCTKSKDINRTKIRRLLFRRIPPHSRIAHHRAKIF